jgi:hypothetical protein
MATGAGAILARVAGEVRRTGFREIRDILHASSPAHVHLRSRLTFVLGATLLVDAVASVLILLFERHAHGTEITNICDSVFWTTTQLLTVSSQLPNPISAPARVLDVFLQAYAISVVAVLAGSWGAFFHRRSMERAPMDASDHPAS